MSNRQTTQRSPLGRFERLQPRNLLAAAAIELGPAALLPEQPYVEVELHDGFTDMGPYDVVGGVLGVVPLNRFLLDTGANSILSAAEATADLARGGYETEGTFHEKGVGGETVYDVSAPYRFEFRGSDGVSHSLPQSETTTRILSSEHEYLGAQVSVGGVAGVAGMPAMVGRVTTLDQTPWATSSDLLNVESPEVRFAAGSDALPATNGHRYSVAVGTPVQFHAVEGLPPDSPPDAPLPAWGPLPFVSMAVEFDGQDATGNFVVDTGAQMTMISPWLAFAIGLDENGNGSLDDEAVSSMPIGGVGGGITAPVMVIDKLRLPTEQGAELVWLDNSGEGTGLQVLVLDIHEGIDGALGADLMAGGLVLEFDFDKIDFVVAKPPYFEQIHFDFREMDNGAGTIYFDVDAAYDEIIPGVAGRHVFYNNSSFDGNDPAPDARDDLAIAVDKRALLPGRSATAANYTSYGHGINGLMVDLHGLPAGVSLDANDFRFRVGNNSAPGSWTLLQIEPTITVRRSAGVGDSDRVTITLPEGAVRGRWLEVTVLPGARTGLSEPDVFYFGNAVGEAGNSAADAHVTATDVLLARNNPRNFLDPAAVDFLYDYNRDGRVTTTDVLLARNNQTNFLDVLKLIEL